jgi:hypothetical protein
MNAHPDSLPPDPESLANFVTKPSLRAGEDPPGASRISTSIRFLRWIELISLESDYGNFRKQEATDAWMFVEGGEAMGPVPFSEILYRLREGQSPLNVIHESTAYDEAPTWSELAYDPAWSRPGTALAWTIGFWVMAISIGFILLRLLLPFGMIRSVGTVAYFLVGIVFAYSRTKPYLKKWTDRVSGGKDRIAP